MKSSASGGHEFYAVTRWQPRAGILKLPRLLPWSKIGDCWGNWGKLSSKTGQRAHRAAIWRPLVAPQRVRAVAQGCHSGYHGAEWVQFAVRKKNGFHSAEYFVQWRIVRNLRRQAMSGRRLRQPFTKEGQIKALQLRYSYHGTSKLWTFSRQNNTWNYMHDVMHS